MKGTDTERIFNSCDYCHLLIMPQKVPSRPDRGSRSEEFNDGVDFDEDTDHNAGSCVRAAFVIRINPMPAGFEEFDWKNGWSLIEEEDVVIYGHGVTGNLKLRKPILRR